jgi:hypothetical protein
VKLDIALQGRRVQRKICEPKREEVMEGWTKLFDKELHNLYSSHAHIMIKS